MHVYSYNSCKHDPKIVFSYDGVDYYAADAKGVEKFDGDFVINFTKTRNTPEVSNYSQLRKFFDMPFEELQVPWPDFGLPKVKIGFWEALHKFIKKKKWKEVCFHCQGGHGRTGTALSAMLVANAGYEPFEAVEWVREVHCDESVESPDQAEYLFEVDKHYNERDAEKEITPSVYSNIGRSLLPSKGEYSDEYAKYVAWWADKEDCASPYHAKGMVDTSGVLSEDDEENEEDEFNYRFIDDEHYDSNEVHLSHLDDDDEEDWDDVEIEEEDDEDD